MRTCTVKYKVSKTEIETSKYRVETVYFDHVLIVFLVSQIHIVSNVAIKYRGKIKIAFPVQILKSLTVSTTDRAIAYIRLNECASVHCSSP